MLVGQRVFDQINHKKGDVVWDWYDSYFPYKVHRVSVKYDDGSIADPRVEDLVLLDDYC